MKTFESPFIPFISCTVILNKDGTITTTLHREQRYVTLDIRGNSYTTSGEMNIISTKSKKEWDYYLYEVQQRDKCDRIHWWDKPECITLLEYKLRDIINETEI